MLKIRRPLGRLIFNMGIAIPGKTVFLIETAPWRPVPCITWRRWWWWLPHKCPGWRHNCRAGSHIPCLSFLLRQIHYSYKSPGAASDWRAYGMDGNNVAPESAETSGLSAGRWCVTGVSCTGVWSCMKVNHGKETLWETSTESSCDGPATPAGPALDAGSCRAGSSTRDGPALFTVLGRQGCSKRVISGSPAELAICAGSAVSGRSAVSAGSAVCAGQQSLSGCPPVTSPLFWDTYTVRFSPLLDDHTHMFHCVASMGSAGVSGHKGITITSITLRYFQCFNSLVMKCWWPRKIINSLVPCNATLHQIIVYW